MHRVFGDDHPSTLTAKTLLANLYCDQAREDEAETLLVEILQAARPVLGENHLTTLASQGLLAWVYVSLGHYDDAEPLLRNTLAAQRRVLPEDDPSLAITLFGLAELHVARGEPAKAEPVFKRAISLVKRLGEANPHIPYYHARYNALVGDRDAAIQFLRRAVDGGFLNPDVIMRDRAFTSLHDNPEFEAIVAEVKKRIGEE